MTRPAEEREESTSLVVLTICFLCSLYVSNFLIASALPCNRENLENVLIPLWRSSRRALMYLEINPLSADVTGPANESRVEGDTRRYPCPAPIAKMASRWELGTVLANERKEVGVEIGVRDGEFAVKILGDWSTAKEYNCVDLWQQQESYDDVSNANNTIHENRLTMTKQRLQVFNQRGVDVVYHRMYSSQAVHKFTDESLDFVYHDARHDYAGLLEDLVSYWPKMRHGAIVAGHDYLDTPDLLTPRRLRWGKQNWSVNMDGSVTPNGKAVRGAVDDFARRVGRQVVVTVSDIDWPSWYIRK